jgi:hypothetical protein
MKLYRYYRRHKYGEAMPEERKKETPVVIIPQMLDPTIEDDIKTL